MNGLEILVIVILALVAACVGYLVSRHQFSANPSTDIANLRAEALAELASIKASVAGLFSHVTATHATPVSVKPSVALAQNAPAVAPSAPIDTSKTVSVIDPSGALGTPSGPSLVPIPAGVIVDPANANNVIGPFGMGGVPVSIPRIFTGSDVLAGLPKASYALNAACTALYQNPAMSDTANPLYAQWLAAYSAQVPPTIAGPFLAAYIAANKP